MYNQYKGKVHRVVIGVGDKVSDCLLENVKNLCELTNMTPRFVHVNESELESAVYLGHAYVGGDAYHISPSLKTWRKENAEKQLEESLQGIAKNLELEHSVVSGDIATSLIADAHSHDASVIVSVAQHDSYKYLLKGFSTSLQLLSESDRPVLIMPNRDDKVFFNKKMTLIIADDLMNTPLSSVVGGCKIAAALGAEKVYHIHVTKDEEDLRKYVNQVKTAMYHSNVPFNPELTEEAAIEKYEFDIKNKMKERTASCRQMLKDKGVGYESLILQGDAFDQLQDFAAKVNSSLLVFGRHTAIHRKPLGIGKIPFRSMMEMGMPVMVFPAEAQI